jgi:hypothetical protein
LDYVLSDASVDRVGDVIEVARWQLKNAYAVAWARQLAGAAPGNALEQRTRGPG